MLSVSVLDPYRESAMNTTPPTELQILRDVVRAISEALPSGWSEEPAVLPSGVGAKTARVLNVTSPGS